MDFSNLTNHLCLTHEEKITAQNIRYQAYTDVNFEPLTGKGLYNDEFDEQDNHFSFLMKENGVPIATARVSIKCADLSWPNVPLERGFIEEVAELSKSHPVIMEIGRLAVLPGIRGAESIAPLALYINGFSFLKYFDNILLVCASGKKHKRFYDRLGLKQITDFAPRPHCAIDLCLMTIPLILETFLEETMLTQEQIDGLLPNIDPLFEHLNTEAPKLSA